VAIEQPTHLVDEQGTDHVVDSAPELGVVVAIEAEQGSRLGRNQRQYLAPDLIQASGVDEGGDHVALVGEVLLEDRVAEGGSHESAS
jgi:hypothetical protein